MVKVRIIKVNQKYNKKYIGKIFEVVEVERKYYKLLIDGMHKFFAKDKCEVVEDVEKSCKTCNYCGVFDDCLLTSECDDFSGWQISEQVKVKPLTEKQIDDQLAEIAGVGQDAPTVKQAGKFENIGRALGELVDEKQQAYGDAITAVEQMMMVLYPNGVNPDQFRDMLLMVRIMDKQCRIAKGDKSAFGESPFKDIAGYGLLGVGHGS